MKRILVMADTHGNKPAIARAIKQFPGIDMVIHLGDHAGDAAYVRTLTDAEVMAVRGNCDWSSDEKSKRLIDVDGKRILAVHGHKQNVKSSLLRLGLLAQEKGADIALFGHSHLPAEKLFGNVILYNPGSLGEPRHLRPSVGIVTIDGSRLSVKTHTVTNV